MKFTDLPLHADVMKGIAAAGFIDCMPVQERVYPYVLGGQDVMVQSKTGSGKTAVFLVAVLQKYVVARDAVRDAGNGGPAAPKLPVALIVAPTRELAVQIEEDGRILASGIPGFRIGCFYGGVGYARQDKQISEGVDLLIGTPGRLLDYQHTGKIDFKQIDTFVIDEADRLFDMGFYPDVQKMFSLMVAREKRQTMLFSATLGTRVRNLAWEYMNNPKEIEVQPEEITVKAITQELYHVSKEEKFMMFLRLLARENPANALVFTNTKAKAVELSKRLAVNGYQVQYLMGDLPQGKRLQVINRMKQGDLKFLVATDVAARGLQIDDLELVFNYDIPEDFESYVHRIGRTARAGKSGKAITLACEQYVYGLEAIENYIQMKIPVLWAQEDELPAVVDKSAGMRFRDLVDESEYASTSVHRGRGGSRSAFGKTSSPYNRDKSQARNPKGSAGAPVRARKSAPVETSAVGPRPSRSKPTYPVPAGQEVRRKPQRPQKSYTDIQSMDFEERIAYYKQLYGTEGPQGKDRATEFSRSGGQEPKAAPAKRKQKKTTQGAVRAAHQVPGQGNPSPTRRPIPNGKPAMEYSVRHQPEGHRKTTVKDNTGAQDKRPVVMNSTASAAEIGANAGVEKPRKVGLLKKLLQRIKGDA